ncbi:cupin domain-containing protein [Afifella sp. JA880]|uniref:cupin domain-containing protein n=1 Tax=Afifella sp. JA880 TaxID=2975280 RepID=UPI0021BB17D9|nr:cupin domain-containing protein [Afifella sp. JA880]MCT8269057.1 cupin domain-containing protein [Afifella sp. JA880]
MPKIDIDQIPDVNSTGYPAPYDTLVAGRFRKRLGNAGGLDQFGVNLCRLQAGAASSQRHWHTGEDEFVFIIEGEVVLVEDGGETILKAGDAATFKAGVANGHHLINRSDRDALLLEVGTRSGADIVTYPDIDLHSVTGEGAPGYTHKDGTPYERA